MTHNTIQRGRASEKAKTPLRTPVTYSTTLKDIYMDPSNNG